MVNQSAEANVHEKGNCEPYHEEGYTTRKAIVSHTTRKATYHEEGRVGHTTSSRDDLSSSSMNGFISDHRIQDLKLHITNSCVCVCVCGCVCVCVCVCFLYSS